MNLESYKDFCNTEIVIRISEVMEICNLKTAEEREKALFALFLKKLIGNGGASNV